MLQGFSMAISFFTETAAIAKCDVVKYNYREEDRQISVDIVKV